MRNNKVNVLCYSEKWSNGRNRIFYNECIQKSGFR